VTQSAQLRTFLWFDNNLEEAINLYSEIFKDQFVLQSSGRPEPDGKLMTAEYTIYGHQFVGMGWPGGPVFNSSISLSISCDGQEETDRLWNALTRDGQAGQCGWCVDPFGVSWQVSPRQMHDYLNNADPEVSAYAWQAMRQMGKIVLADLQRP
jgi:predicted 3-demethylubiquinone-9 3-methyltransferase (glyoxalase superfamily)